MAIPIDHHIGPDKIKPIPREIEYKYDTIVGLLRCSKCGELLGHGREFMRSPGRGDSWFKSINPKEWTPLDHVCASQRNTNVDWLLNNGIHFPYDYASPLTIREQLQEWIKGGHTQTTPHADDNIKHLRCDGYRVFPDGSPCIGCPDCEHLRDQSPPQRNRKTEKKEDRERKRTMFDD